MFSAKKEALVAAGGGTSIIGNAVVLTGDVASTADIRRTRSSSFTQISDEEEAIDILNQ